LDDGMCQLTHVLPAVLGEAIWDRLTQQAKAINHARATAAEEAAAAGPSGGDGDHSENGENEPDIDAEAATQATSDPRTFDQLRSDLATELLLTGQPGTDA